MYTIDPVTLRERITDQDSFDHELAQLRAAQAQGADVRAQLVPMLRIAGRFDEAERLGRDYLGQLDPNVSPARVDAARIRLAHVLQYKGEFDEALRLFTLAVDATTGSLHAFALQHRGKCYLERALAREDAGDGAAHAVSDLRAGLTDFNNAMSLRIAAGVSEELVQSSRIAVRRAEELLARRDTA